MSSSVREATSEIEIKGQSASPGIAIGTIVRFDESRQQVVFSHIAPDRVRLELRRLRRGLGIARKQLSLLKEKMGNELGQEHAYILDAQILMLQDRSLFESIERTISERLVNAEWAIELAIEPFLAAYASISDGYLRQRGSDIEDVASRLTSAITGGRKSQKSLKANSILVSTDLPPSVFGELQLAHLAGIGTCTGGWASHTAIIARGLRIPCVVGLNSVTEFHSGQPAIVDGTEGLIIINPIESTLNYYKGLSVRRKRSFNALVVQSKHPAITADGQEIRLRANVELLSEADSINRFGAQGIGLFRSEYLYSNMLPQARSEEGQVEIYTKLADAAGEHGVAIRTFDLNLDKVSPEAEPEQNPVLGLRGIRLALKQRELFTTQIRAILRASVRKNLRVILPMVTQVGEVFAARRILTTVAEQLKAQHIPYDPDIPLGVMVEVPATAVVLDQILPFVDFVNLGTNDLIQYLLAVDRNNQHVSNLYLPLHPAVLRALRHIVEAARVGHKPLEVCGEMASNPVYCAVLLGLGINSLSVTPSTIPVLKDAVRHLDLNLVRGLLERVKQMNDATEIENYLTSELKTHARGFFETFKI